MSEARGAGKCLYGSDDDTETRADLVDAVHSVSAPDVTRHIIHSSSPACCASAGPQVYAYTSVVTLTWAGLP